MEGTAGIGIGGSVSAVRIPQRAVVRRDGEAVVFVVSDGVARLRKVTLGSANPREVLGLGRSLERVPELKRIAEGRAAWGDTPGRFAEHGTDPLGTQHLTKSCDFF